MKSESPSLYEVLRSGVREINVWKDGEVCQKLVGTRRDRRTRAALEPASV